MKFALILLSLGSFAFGLDRFPQGRFAGHGVKTYADGTTKTYSLEVNIKDNTLNFSYQLPSGPVGYDLTLAYGKFGFYKVGEIGDGYCSTSICHYSVSLGQDVTEEWTFHFMGTKLFKVGSIKGPKVHAFWEEELELK